MTHKEGYALIPPVGTQSNPIEYDFKFEELDAFYNFSMDGVWYDMEVRWLLLSAFFY